MSTAVVRSKTKKGVEWRPVNKERHVECYTADRWWSLNLF